MGGGRGGIPAKGNIAMLSTAGGRAGAREGRLAGWLTGRLPGWPAAWQMILCERATSRQYAASSRLAHMTK